MGRTRKAPSKGPRGFTIAELLIVISVIGILSSVSIPIYLEQKDKAIIEVTRANLDVIRTSLGQYAVRSLNNAFPQGDLDYYGIRLTLPETRLPALEADAQFLSGSFLYSGGGATYILRATSLNRTGIRFEASPTGVFSK